MKSILLYLCCLMNVSILHAQTEHMSWFTENAAKQVTIDVDFYLSSTCAYCHKEDLFFKSIEKKAPWLIVHRHIVNQDKAALKSFYEHLQHQNETLFSVPALFFCDSHWVGFSDKDTTGKMLLQAMRYCRNKIKQQGVLTKETISVLREQSASAKSLVFFGKVASSDLFILWAALMDAFNPCALFCFAAFLAFIWLYPQSRRAQYILGGLFLITLGATHYLQLIYSLRYYQKIAQWTPLAMFVGFILLMMVYPLYRKKSLQQPVYPSLSVMMILIAVVFSVQSYQQTCAFNMAFIFNEWLIKKAYSPVTQLIYQLIYQLLYLMPMILLLLLYVSMTEHRRIKPYKFILQWAAYLILSCIGIILLVFPSLLANLWTSIFVLLLSISIGWLLERRHAKIN